MPALSKLIDRLAAAELCISALALPLSVLALQLPGATPAALAACNLLALLILVSGALFAIDARLPAITGGRVLREGTVRKQQPFVREGPRLGANELCHCGSGKKYKRCCADADRASQCRIVRSELRPS